MLTHRLCICILFGLIGMITGWGFADPTTQTVPGPEDHQLLPRISGYLLTTRDYRSITAIQLPSGKQSLIHLTRPKHPDQDDPTIHAISGPDSQGRIVYIEDHFFVADKRDRRHSLKVLNIDGAGEKALFTRPGDAMWATTAAGHGEIGNSLALAPAGGQVAFISALSDAQMRGALFSAGTIEVWNLNTGTGGKSDIHCALDEGLAWFHDGRRLAYVKFIDRKDSTLQLPNDKSYGSEYASWPEVPCVMVHDFDKRTDAVLSVGFFPVVSTDGRSVLVCDSSGNYNLIDVASGKARSDNSPARRSPRNGGGAVVALIGDRTALQWAVRTTGSPVRYTDNNSPLVGPKQMLALEAATLGDGHSFQTVVPSLDPRVPLTFGACPSGGNEHERKPRQR